MCTVNNGEDTYYVNPDSTCVGVVRGCGEQNIGAFITLQPITVLESLRRSFSLLSAI
jgi:hypothetical protein